MPAIINHCIFCSFFFPLNPFPHVKTLDQSKMKAVADDKLNITKTIVSVFDRVESIVGKGEIAYTSNFSFSHNVFFPQQFLSQTRQKVSLCGYLFIYISLYFIASALCGFPFACSFENIKHNCNDMLEQQNRAPKVSR